MLATTPKQCSREGRRKFERRPQLRQAFVIGREAEAPWLACWRDLLPTGMEAAIYLIGGCHV